MLEQATGKDFWQLPWAQANGRCVQACRFCGHVPPSCTLKIVLHREHSHEMHNYCCSLFRSWFLYCHPPYSSLSQFGDAGAAS